MSTLLLLIIGCCSLAPNIEASFRLAAAVYLKSNDADIKALKNVAGVSVVYKIKPIWFWSADKKGEELNDSWNYAVVGKDLKDRAAQDKLISDVGALDFVQLSAGYRLGIDDQFNIDQLNEWLKKADPKFFVKRPMRAASPKPPCTRMDLKEGQRLKLMTIGRRGDIKEMTKLSREQFMRIFPAIKLSFNFLGQVDPSHKSVWSDLTIMDYIDNNTWCEYAQSQWAKDYPTRFPNAFKGMGAVLAVEL